MPSVPSLVVGTVGLLLRRRRCSHATRHRRRRQCCPRRRVTLKTFNIDSIHYQVVVIAAHPPPPPTTSTTPSTALGSASRRYHSQNRFNVGTGVTDGLTILYSFPWFKITPGASKLQHRLDSGPQVSMRGFNSNKILPPAFKNAFPSPQEREYTPLGRFVPLASVSLPQPANHFQTVLTSFALAFRDIGWDHGRISQIEVIHVYRQRRCALIVRPMDSRTGFGPDCVGSRRSELHSRPASLFKNAFNFVAWASTLKEG
ncbi:hypothetical protein C8R43DRAFT_1121966 [Mycena crocata]|nr:hypothetical protein C8R43DRAFT_1121966 [Mycena crocata]